VEIYVKWFAQAVGNNHHVFHYSHKGNSSQRYLAYFSYDLDGDKIVQRIRNIAERVGPSLPVYVYLQSRLACAQKMLFIICKQKKAKAFR